MNAAPRIRLDDIVVPAEVSLHARCVIQIWLMHARVAAEKRDWYEAHRLVGLVKAKIGDEMARSRPCED